MLLSTMDIRGSRSSPLVLVAADVSLEEAASVMVAIMIVWWPALDVRGVSVLCLLREGAEIFVCCFEMCVVYAHWRVRGDTCNSNVLSLRLTALVRL